MIPMMSEHDRWLRACYAGESILTREEISDLSYCASMAACREHISREQYHRAEELTRRVEQAQRTG